MKYTHYYLRTQSDPLEDATSVPVFWFDRFYRWFRKPCQLLEGLLKGEWRIGVRCCSTCVVGDSSCWGFQSGCLEARMLPPVYQPHSVNHQPRSRWESHSLCSDWVHDFCHSLEVLGWNGRRSWQHRTSHGSYAVLGSHLSHSHATEFDGSHGLICRYIFATSADKAYWCRRKRMRISNTSSCKRGPSNRQSFSELPFGDLLLASNTTRSLVVVLSLNTQWWGK